MEGVALGFAIFSAVNGSIGLLNILCARLENLEKRRKNSKDDVGTRLGKLHELAEQIKKVVENIEAELKKVVKEIKEGVDSTSPNPLESVESGITKVLKENLNRNVEKATTLLKELDDHDPSSAGSSSGWGKLSRKLKKTGFGRFAKIKSISEALDRIESCLQQALQGAFNIEVLRTLQTICPPKTEEEKFKAYFGRPLLPSNLVLNFDTDKAQEGRLLHKLLASKNEDSADGTVAVGSNRDNAMQGMGGVGKTTALRAICHQKKVMEAFPDGICYLEFGQNATDRNVQQQLERCIRQFGGLSTADKIEEQSTLAGTAKQAANWLGKKEILLVCDDLWGSPTSKFGYLSLLRQLVRDSPDSRLLVSTRDLKIAKEVSSDFETFGPLLSEKERARNLLCQVAFGKGHNEKLKELDIEGYVTSILNICAGLQLALCMAGHALGCIVGELKDIEKGFEVYARQLERDKLPDDEESSAQLYDHALSYIVEASLVQCEQWAENSLPNVNVQSLFRSLCVLEKQMTMPKSMLSKLWGLTSRKTDRIVRMFADLNLITKTKHEERSKLSQ